MIIMIMMMSMIKMMLTMMMMLMNGVSNPFFLSDAIRSGSKITKTKTFRVNSKLQPKKKGGAGGRVSIPTEDVMSHSKKQFY